MEKTKIPSLQETAPTLKRHVAPSTKP
ncbi:uncharacterized protein G2W53_032482 [Senna tora]|uniref:Uncharacterized protein n=1 Tax=Senna tora TaxID=362788 RepID=A0A834WA94_9FABA|nr:uncharacterized protein G2W53_032482 [Senna tora]